MKLNRIGNQGQVYNLPFSFCKGPGKIWVCAILLALTLGIHLGVSPTYAQAPPGSYSEEEAQAIDQMLMCPVCPAESIDQAQVPLARQMRQRVREMLSEGASRQQVLDYFADRYGQNVLASPPKSGFNLLAWILPIVALVGSLAAALLVLRAMTRRNDAQAADTLEGISESEDLEPYLAAVDRSLAMEDKGGDKDGDTEGRAER